MAGEIETAGVVTVRGITASMRPRPIGRGDIIGSGVLPVFTAASMRPRPIGRGDPGHGGVFRPGHQASMRPRPIGRGDGAYPPAVRTLGAASMRPRPIGRGDRGASYRKPQTRGCFNEAPANWPGRCRLPPRPLAPRWSFNEAPANWPGRLPTHQMPRS